MPEHQQMQQSKDSKSTVQKQATPRILTPISYPMTIIQRARINPKSLTPADVLQLQRTIGNREVGRLLLGIRSSTAQQAPVQREEKPEEKEEELLQGKFESKSEATCPSCYTTPVQREESPEEDEELLQGKMMDTVQRQGPKDEEELMQGKFASGLTSTLQAREEAPPNKTGMPDRLKSGLESLSGMDISGVRVHSPKPAQLNALAYTQGQDIHVGPGQERHLAHEGWHAVQQMQGRVRATRQITGLGVNNEADLEREADTRGAKALQVKSSLRRDPQFQPKLTLGPVGDKYEQEADRVARQVVETISSPDQGAVQRQEDLEDEDELRRKVAVAGLTPAAEGADVGPDLESAIHRARSGGQPLLDGLLLPMERAFGADFGGVRVHTDGVADSLNRSLQARAFTTGQDIFLRQGEYQPGSSEGQRLLAHELTHVVQQAGNATSLPKKRSVSCIHDVYEHEAEEIADRRFNVPVDTDRTSMILQKTPKYTHVVHQEGCKTLRREAAGPESGNLSESEQSTETPELQDCRETMQQSIPRAHQYALEKVEENADYYEGLARVITQCASLQEVRARIGIDAVADLIRWWILVDPEDRELLNLPASLSTSEIHSQIIEPIEHIARVYRLVEQGLQSGDFNYECEYRDSLWYQGCDGARGSTPAFIRGDIHFCVDDIDPNDIEELANTIVHEASHIFAGTTDELNPRIEKAEFYADLDAIPRLEACPWLYEDEDSFGADIDVD